MAHPTSGGRRAHKSIRGDAVIPAVLHPHPVHELLRLLWLLAWHPTTSHAHHLRLSLLLLLGHHLPREPTHTYAHPTYTPKPTLHIHPILPTTHKLHRVHPRRLLVMLLTITGVLSRCRSHLCC